MYFFSVVFGTLHSTVNHAIDQPLIAIPLTRFHSIRIDSIPGAEERSRAIAKAAVQPG